MPRLVQDVHVAVDMVGVAIFVAGASPDAIAADGYVKCRGTPISIGFVEGYVQVARDVQVGVSGAYQSNLGRAVYRLAVRAVCNPRVEFQVVIEIEDCYRRVLISGNEARFDICIYIHI